MHQYLRLRWHEGLRARLGSPLPPCALARQSGAPWHRLPPMGIPRMTSSLLIRAAPYLFIFIWSSGYVVAKLGLPYAQPLTFLCIRYALVVVMMLVLTKLSSAAWPRRPREIAHIAFAGVLMQACYLGGVWCAIKLRMPAGVAALIVNTQPILTAVLSRSVGERVSGRQWIGLGLGLAGVALVLANKITSGGLAPLPIALSVFALLSMTCGVLYQKRFCPHFDVRTGQVIQFLASLAVTLPLALALEDTDVTWSADFIIALTWSVLVLSGAGISLLFLMIRRGAATEVTSYFYLVPPVTALMAWVLFREVFDAMAIAGMVLTVVAVALVVRSAPGGPRTRAAGMRK
jgi:drug/metabolite transporter (DMT)-like permease